MFHLPGDGVLMPRWFSVTPGNSSDDTVGTPFVTLRNLVAGQTYAVHGLVAVSSVAGATGMNLRATASGGLVAAESAFSWITPLATTANTASSLLEGWTGFTAGLGATTRLMTVSGVLVVTVSGDLILEFRSEVAASRVDVLYGTLGLVPTTT